MNNTEGHLTIEQIESLLAVRTKEKGPAGSDLRETAELHLAQCTACQKVLVVERRIRTALRDLRATGQAAEGATCPSSATLYNLAAGQISGEDASIVLKHIAECDYCGAEFHQATTALDSETTDEEATLLHSLRTRNPEWQATFARELAAVSLVNQEHHSSKVHASSFWRLPRFAWAFGIGATILAVLLIAGIKWRSSPAYAAQLLARAYSEQRTMELRIPGAEYAALRIARGPGSSRLDRPPSLLRAEELIGRRLAERPGDASWLETKARADIVDGNYDAALKTLESLPDSTAVLIDRATAYFERGEATEAASDFGTAVEALGKVLAEEPDNLTALFNRAIICERISLYSQARTDWERYLSIDPKSQWAGEAREHLRQLDGKQTKREKRRAEPLLTPVEFARIVDRQEPAHILDGRFEEYLSVALQSWFSDSQSNHKGRRVGPNEAEIALNILAKMAMRDHQDAWLHDLLISANSPGFGQAVRDLSEAATSNERADSASAKQYAAEAERLFHTMTPPNTAGELRAKLETMFASKIDQDGEACLKNAGAGESIAAKKSYKWLEIQFLLEEGSCYWLLGNLGSARQDYLLGAELAEKSGYHSLFLRSQDHFSGIEVEIGNFESAWQISSTALNQFWSGNYSDVRGYNLYYNLYELSRIRNQPHLQMSAWRDGVLLSESSLDLAQRAMAHSLLANTAWATQDAQTANEELNKAETLFSASPDSRSTQLARLEAECRHAMIETALGKSDRAIARLRTLEQSVQVLGDPYLAILLYTCLGDAELEARNPTGAEFSLRSAVALADSQLASLQEERSRVEWSAKSERAYRDLVELELEQGQGERALTLWEFYRGASLRTVSQPGPSPLPSGAFPLTLVYAFLPRSLAIWVYDGRSIKAFWSQRQPGKIEADVAAYERFCGNPQSAPETINRYGRELYRELIAPVESYLSWNRILVIEPDDGLGGLPFEALIDQGGHYLGEKTDLTLSLGMDYYRRSRDTTPIATSSHALIVAIRNSSAIKGLELPPLPDAEVEGDVIAGKFREAHVLKGDEANEGALFAQLAGSEVFHFSGHAVISPGRSGLLLTHSLLRAVAFEESSSSTLQLAVLSACTSEEGSNGRVTDGDSLVRTLLSRRVPHVVASRWEVDSRTTAHFMSVFYDGVLAGESVSKAIRRAQTELRANRETAHPFYWSAFATFGRT